MDESMSGRAYLIAARERQGAVVEMLHGQVTAARQTGEAPPWRLLQALARAEEARLLLAALLDPDDEVATDTSDIPEVGEEWFRGAKLKGLGQGL